MRKGISSLCGVVHERMGCSVRNGDVFIFIGSSRKLMKLLHAEDGGLVMYVKRLEAGHFKVPEYDEKSRSYPMEWRDLVIMVEGIRGISRAAFETSEGGTKCIYRIKIDVVFLVCPGYILYIYSVIKRNGL
ncbi:IS66 family insertion sequence element accessory protein TnpB [Bacteroides xylanisolvens]|nr:IS66 family insertion sequence element accessory protein TnpB [Bacteroides xylanisolvens]